MPWLSDLKGALQRLGKREEPQPERWPATGLAALYGVGCASTPARIKDISTAGIYLFTQEHLPPANWSSSAFARKASRSRAQICSFPLRLGSLRKRRMASSSRSFSLRA